MVTKEDISIDPAKVEAIVNWPKPANITEIISFLGLAGYYKRFVNGFSSLVAPLTKLTRKNVKFEWNDECEKSFKELKNRLISALILTVPSSSGSYVIYNDAFRKGLGCVLM